MRHDNPPIALEPASVGADGFFVGRINPDTGQMELDGPFNLHGERLTMNEAFGEWCQSAQPGASCDEH